MLVLPPNLKIVAAIDGVVTSAVFGGILFNFFYHNRGNDCVTEPYSSYYGKSCYWARYIGIE